MVGVGVFGGGWFVVTVCVGCGDLCESVVCA